MQITLVRAEPDNPGKSWLYKWSVNDATYYFIAEKNIKKPVNEYTRNLMNVLNAGCKAIVEAEYNVETKTLTVKPDFDVDLPYNIKVEYE